MSVAELPPDVVEEVRQTFCEFDIDGNGQVSSRELGEVFQALGENVPGYKLREMISEVDTDKNGTLSFDEFLRVYQTVTSKGVFGQWTSLMSRREGIASQGASEASAGGTAHTSSEAEATAFAAWINSELKSDPDCAQYLPLTAGDLVNKCKDGLLICKLINLSVPKTIDERAINKARPNAFLIHENLTLAVNSAQAIGCTVANIAPDDIAAGKPHLVLGLLWQIFRIGLFANINLATNPNMLALLEEGETAEDLLKLSPEELLLRWLNYHLRKAGSTRRTNNFSGDVKDSEVYAVVLNRIAPQEFSVNRPERIMAVGDLSRRADMVLAQADKLGCRHFVSSKDIPSGNTKLNLAFVANLFNHFPALDPADIEDVELEPYEESREERTYRNWMNSLGVNPYIYHLYNDLRTGLVLFQLYEDIKKGTVDFAKVNKPPFKLATGGNMKKIENCNYVVELGKQSGYSLVGIGGEDIYNGTHTLVLALVWQMLRAYSLSFLPSDQPVKDAEIVDWVNNKLQSAGKTSRLQSFKDPSIASGHALIDLVDAIKPGSVQYNIVTAGGTDKDKVLNATYGISMARKIGARIYTLPEDVVEVKPKMMLTLFAALMARALSA